MATWCTFWGRYFLSLIILLKNIVLISEKSLKSLHEDLWSPLIFKDPKFTKNFIRGLKIVCFSKKKENIFTISLRYFTKISKKIFYFWRPFRISEDLWISSKYFQPCENAENMLKYTKKSLYCMFHLYFFILKKMHANSSSITNVCKFTTSKTNT